MSLLKVLAGKLGTREVEDAVRSEVESLVSLREGLVKCTGVENSSGVRVLLAAVEKSVVEGKSAIEKLQALVKALGVDDTEGAVGRITDLVKQAKELEDAMPELKELREEKEAREEAEVEIEVEEAMASRGLGEEMKDALLLFRKTKPEEFRAKFPKIAASNQQATSAVPKVLTQPLVATPQGAQLSVGGNGSQVLMSQPGATPAGQSVPGDVVNLDVYVGEGNPTQRAMAHLKATRPDFNTLSHDQKFTAAVQLKKQPNVKFTPQVL